MLALRVSQNHRNTPIHILSTSRLSFLNFFSQIIGILMVIIFPKFGRQLDQHQKLIEVCSKDMKDTIVILDYSSKIFYLF